ncbi:MAG: hypothetical protein KDJ31_09990 [Candidatus Competibacteraceae bacterium]|nr:hypothetical protein [Candidatus Competibacteraceae bacterium]MCB1820676.1 hypothetical protein [Candidatus Competibacteraceae bacterium]
MKTVLTTAAFALTLGLSSLAHAGFNDQGPTLNNRSAATSQRQDLSHLPTVTGFNQQSHHAAGSVNAVSHASPSLAQGANCDLNRTAGFQNSQSVASC